MVNYKKTIKKNTSLGEIIKSLKLENAELESKLNKVKEAMEGTLHEVRRFSAQISINAELLNRSLTEEDYKSIDDYAKTILYTSGLISSRLAFTDLELNPRAIRLQSTSRSVIYKKFEKASHILKQAALQKHINIKFTGNSYKEIEALPSFELVPFVVLENSIKYSPNNQKIEINFDADSVQQGLQVHVKSIGPVLKDDELQEIFQRGFRGSNAKKLSVGGEGLGLFLVKFLCDFHDIHVAIKSSPSPKFLMNNIPYSQFEVTFSF